MNLTKEQALAKIKELQDYINQAERILVPYCIKIGKPNKFGGLGIINGNQELYYNYNTKVYWIVSNTDSTIIPCELIEVQPKDRKAGDIYYASDRGLEEIEDIDRYKIYLGDDKYMYWDKVYGINYAYINNYDWKQRYEVRPI